MKSVYIAGRSGTSGLVLHEMVRRREDLRLLAPEVQGRDALERETELLNAADVAVLCLPAAVVNKTLARITNPDVRVIDTSTAHSVGDQWVYGLPELRPAVRRFVLVAIGTESKIGPLQFDRRSIGKSGSPARRMPGKSAKNSTRRATTG